MRDLTKDTVETGIDMLGDVHPAFKILAPMMKLMVSPVYGVAFGEEEADPNQMILDKLDEINDALDGMENRMKEHMENVVVLANLGGDTGAVSVTAEALRTRISDIKRNPGLSQSQKLSQIEEQGVNLKNVIYAVLNTVDYDQVCFN